jgi:hypothetical protein
MDAKNVKQRLRGKTSARYGGKGDKVLGYRPLSQSMKVNCSDKSSTIPLADSFSHQVETGERREKSRRLAELSGEDRPGDFRGRIFRVGFKGTMRTGGGSFYESCGDCHVGLRAGSLCRAALSTPNASGFRSSPVQEPGKDSIINRFPPAAIGRVLTADSIHREQQYDRDDDD